MMITIRRLRLIVFLSSLLLVAVSLVVTLWALGTQRDDARVINLAGRQRMLIQQMNLEVLGVQIGANPIYRQTLHKTADTFEQILDALTMGGEVPYTDETTVTLPATPADETRILDQLAIVRATWDEMHPTIHRVLESDPQSAAFTEAVARVEQLSPTLLAQMDEVVRLYEVESRRKVDFVQDIGFGFLVVAVALLLAVYVVTERQILQPIDRLRAAAQHIGEGDLATPVPNMGLGEIDALAHSLDEMRRKLGASAEAQTALLELSHRLLAAKDEYAVAECAVDAAASALGTDFSTLVLADADGRLLTRAVRGWPADFAGHFELGRGNASLAGYTVLHGHPVAVEDYATETAFTVPPVVFERGIVSGLSVPMILEGRVVGAMLVHSQPRRRFGNDEIQLLSLIANQTAIALDKAHLLATERQRADELEILYSIATVGVEATSVNAVISPAIRIIDDALKPDYFGIGLVDEPAGVLRISRSTRSVREERLTIPLGQGVAGQVIATGKPGRIPDVSHAPAFLSVNPGTRSELCIPLKAGERVIGVINIESIRPNAFSEADERLMTVFAGQLATAIEKVRLFESERRRHEAATALLEITQVASSSLELGQVLKHIAQRTASACRANRCTIFLLDEVGEYLQPVMSQFADGHADLEQWQVFKTTTADRVDVVPLFRDAIRECHPGLLNDSAHTELIPLKWTQPFGIQKMLVVPLVSHDRAIGLMAIDHTDASREFSPAQIDLALTIGGQVAASIENARLFAESQQHAAEMNALQQTALDLVSHLETQPLLETIVRRATDLLSSAGGLIYQWEQSSQQLRCTISYSLSRDYTHATLKPGEGMAGRVYLTGKPLVVNDYAHWEGRAAHMRDIPSRAVISVPILWHDRVIGVINVNDESGARTFDDRDIQVLSLFANQAAIAMENARLFEEIQRLAVTDSLTGLPNRRYFFELAEREFQRARRYGRSVTAIMLDIDHFKRVNDTYGHAVGDEVLRAVAERSRKNLRDIDVLGRYGGEEFVAVLPETDLDGTRDVAERLRRCMAEVPIVTAGGLVTVTISLGIAISTEGCPNVAALINQADTGMYAAKAAGRNRVGEDSAGER